MIPLFIQYSLCIFLLTIIGILSLIKEKHSYKFVLFLFSSSVILWITALYFGYFFLTPGNETFSSIFIQYSYGFGGLANFFSFLFLYIFPKKNYSLNKYFEYFLYGFTIIIFLLSTQTNLIYESVSILIPQEAGIDNVGNLYGLFILYFLTIYGSSIFIGMKKTKILQGIEKTKFNYSFIGLSIVFAGAILINVLFPIFQITHLQEESPLISLIFAFFSFYAMQKYRFLNLSNIILKTIRIIILSSIFILGIILIHTFLNKTTLFTNNALIITLISSILGGLIFLLTTKILPPLISAQIKEFQHTLKEIRVKLYNCEQYSQLQQILENAFVLKLHISQARIFLLREKEENINIPIYIHNSFSNELEKFKKDVLVFEEIGIRPKTKNQEDLFKKEMKKLDASLSFPLFSEEKMIGFFILGQKENKDPYTKEEIDEILNIIHNLEVVFMNILLKRNFEKENNMMREIIKQKTEQLQKQFKEIKKILKQQSDFIAVTAHEFRTPLSIALFKTEDTLDTHENNKEVTKDLKEIESALENLKELTDTLFEVQKYDLDKIILQKEDVNLETFLNEVYQNTSPIMKKKNIQYSYKNTIPKNTIFSIDSIQIRQVLNNLLNNAFKHTPNNGIILLQTEIENNNIIISIQNSGQKIPNKNKVNLFEKFRTEKKEQAGIGLGLYICKKIIDLHKGEIWIEDSSLGGADFRISLN